MLYRMGVCCRYIVCVACKERILSVFNTNGQRLLPDIILDSEISYLSVNRHHCMVVTSQYLLSLWWVSDVQLVLSVTCITVDTCQYGMCHVRYSTLLWMSSIYIFRHLSCHIHIWYSARYSLRTLWWLSYMDRFCCRYSKCIHNYRY